MNPKKFIDAFSKRTVVVIGDLMLDKYIFGKVERISPEAPVQIVSVEKENYVPGGAANAACNVASLGGNAYLFGIVGNDISKDILLEETKNKGIDISGVIIDGRKPTIQKIRVLGQNQQLLRIDYENDDYIDDDMHQKMISKIASTDNIDAIIISDYAKGTITEALMQKIIDIAKDRQIPLIIDPKPKHKHLYRGASLITPNKKEAEEMSGMMIRNEDDLTKAGEKLNQDIGCDILITMGERGMSLFRKDKKPMHIPTTAKEVYDVSGAGDTVVASLSLAISSGMEVDDAAILANNAAGLKVAKLGTASVTKEELLLSIK